MVLSLGTHLLIYNMYEFFYSYKIKNIKSIKKNSETQNEGCHIHNYLIDIQGNKIQNFFLFSSIKPFLAILPTHIRSIHMNPPDYFRQYYSNDIRPLIMNHITLLDQLSQSLINFFPTTFRPFFVNLCQFWPNHFWITFSESLLTLARPVSSHIIQTFVNFILTTFRPLFLNLCEY